MKAEIKDKLIHLVDLYEKSYLHVGEGHLLMILAEFSECISELLPAIDVKKQKELETLLVQMLAAMEKKDFVLVNDILTFKMKGFIHKLRVVIVH